MSVLLTEFNDIYFRDIASILCKKSTSISHIVTSFPELYKGKTEFSKTKIILEHQFQYNDFISNLNTNSKESLSKDLILDNQELENLYLTISDRLCFYPKSVVSRKQRYYDLLLFWSTFLKKNKITTIIFPRVPHLGYGNILYYLAKKQGIRVYIFRETLLNEVSLITSDYNNYAQIPKKYLQNLSLEKLKEKLGTNYYDLIFNQSELMKINTSDNSAVMRQNTSSALINIFDLKTLKSLLTLVHNPFSRVYGTPFYMEKPINWLGYYLMLFLYYFKNSALFSHYRLLSQPIDFNSKFIYFPLHYQPERTSLPEGGVFENQLLIVDILSKSIPSNWFVYVKEHPYQFLRSDIRKMNFRSKEFYERIAQYKNVKVVPISTPSEKLIHYCQTSVTVTGSTGWETLLTGKPCITFSSSAWYSPCNSSFVVNTQTELKKALAQIKSKTKNDVLKDIIKFFLYYKNKFIPTASSYETAIQSQKSYDFLVEVAATAFLNKIKA